MRLVCIAVVVEPVMWRGTGCDSSTAFKALVSPPPVLSAAEARSFEDVVAGTTNYLHLRCNCSRAQVAQVTPEHVRATRGDFAQLLPLLLPQLPSCACGRKFEQFHPSHTSHWQQFFDAAWAWVKASDDHEQAMAAHCSRSIFTLV